MPVIDRIKPTPFHLLDAEEKKRRVKMQRGESSARNKAEFNVANNIDPLPEVVDPQRREECKWSFKLHCETYNPYRFELRWSKDHLELLQTMEDAILKHVGLHAFACFRGFGKTTIAESLAQWALLHGHKKFIVFIAATGPHAKALIESMWLDLETNELLYEDFPEVCYPIRMLERNMQRAVGQHLNSCPTMIYKKQDQFVLPTIEGNDSSGSKAQAVGITGSVRGLKHLLANGQVIRPDFVMIDDPQTDKSAKSNVMTAAREKVINGAILGLAGPRTAITAVMPCTVIRSNDLAERFIDKVKRPEWQGKRTKLLVSFPKNMEYWRKYADIRAEGLRAGMGQSAATEYYRANQSTMDEGAECSWLERFDPHLQISAIQAAMDIYFTDPSAFYSEYQNDPLKDGGELGPHQLHLSFEGLIQRSKKSKYRVVPRDTLYITSGTDIQGKILYYLTVAWTSDFGGTIVDYGTYPKQDTFDGWTAQNPPIPLGFDNPDIGLVPKVFAGLDRIKDDAFSLPFIRDEIGGNEYIQKCLIDANWALAADAVYAFCKQNEQGNIYIPCHGRGVTATMVPMEQWAKKLGEKRYWNARILPNTQDKNRGRHATYDGNAWKSVIAERLTVPLGSENALGFYGENPYHHQRLIEHLIVEKPIKKKGRGREVDEWEAPENIVENHWWDCLIQAAVAANILGLKPHVQTLVQSNAGQPDTTVTAPATEKTRRVATAPPMQRKPFERGL